MSVGEQPPPPRETRPGRLVAFTADLRADAFIRRAPCDGHAVFRAQQVAVLVGQDDRAILEAAMPFSAPFAGRQLMDEDRVGELGLFAAQDGLDGRVGDVADHALLRALGVDAEAAGGKPEVSFVVKDHGQEILFQRLAQRGLPPPP